MVVSKTIKTRYEELAVYAPTLRKLVREILEPFCVRQHFDFHDRIKALESVAEKLETGRVRSWDELDDLYAATIVIPSLREEKVVSSELESHFVRKDFRSRGSSRTPPDTFRFDLPRFYGRLRPSPEREGTMLESMIFEVQIRTAFEHAWCTTTHELTYKAAHSDWKKQRLTAALRATVEQIDLSIAGFEQVVEEVLPGKWEESETKTQLLEYFDVLFEKEDFPSEVKPSALSRFADNVYSLCQAEASRRNYAERGRAKQRKRRVTVEDIVSETKRVLDNWVTSTRPEEVPRSLSLFQTVYGLLCRHDVVGSGVRFTIFGIDDISGVFPEARGRAEKEF